MYDMPNDMLPTSIGIDHLVYACADLESGMDEIGDLLGVRPAHGGRHVDFGTHNALLSLGPDTYLEVIARDPDLTLPDQGALAEISNGQKSHLVTWVLRTEEIDLTATTANSAGVAIGAVQTGSREKPDGSILRWQLTDPYAMPLGGAIPFLISWGDTPHPAAAVPAAGELLNLTIEHPYANRVRESISILGFDIDVVQTEAYRLVARIQTKHGIRILT